VGQCEIDEHFPGCHPEHAEGDREPDRLPEPGEAQDCWHCGTPTPQGCHCVECLDGADYIPPEYAYHCPVCKRWWATMMPVITTITFGEPEAPRDGAP
jgi:hypothetical protein